MGLNDIVKSGVHYVYIGLNDIAKNGVFMWQNGDVPLAVSKYIQMYVNINVHVCRLKRE